MWLAPGVCPHCPPNLKTSFSLRLVEQYLPRVWPGVVIALPALLVIPSYDQSLWFHLWMGAAWIYWVFSIYKLHITMRKKNRSYEVNPLQASLITGLIGSHPFNYLLELFVAVLTLFPGTASGLVIVPAIPLLFILGFWWYRRMFNQICSFVKEQRDDQMAPANPGSLIALFLLAPGALQLLLRAMGLPMEYAIWVSEALFPIGLVASFCLLYSFRNRVARLLANDADFRKLAHSNLKEIGTESSSDL